MASQISVRSTCLVCIYVSLISIYFSLLVSHSEAALIPEAIGRWFSWHRTSQHLQGSRSAGLAMGGFIASSVKSFQQLGLPESSSKIPSYVTGAVFSNHTSYFPIDYSRQMMHRAEVDLIASYLLPTDVYLEYGSGGSTINFTPLVARAYSVEHDCQWAQFISNSLRTSPNVAAYSNLRIKCIPILPGFRSWGTLSNFEHANYQQFRKYVDVVDSLPEQSFDKVFIDGRARLACALKILPYLKPDSVVFIHDFYARTQHYGSLLRYYEEVARVRAVRNQDESQGPIDEPQGLIVLRRAANISFPLTTQHIDDIYDSVDWRIPFGPPLTSVHAYGVYLSTYFDIGKWRRARTPRVLVSLVKKDVFRLVCLYVVGAFLWSVVCGRPNGPVDDASTGDANGNSIAMNSGLHLVCNLAWGSCKNIGWKFQGDVTRDRKACGEPRFIETDGMKAANARRKRTSIANVSRTSV